MRKGRFSEEQIINVLKEHQPGIPVVKLCRRSATRRSILGARSTAADEPEAAFLGCKDVLDPRTHAGFFALELRPETAALEQGQMGRRAVGGIGPQIADDVVAIEHRAKLVAITCRRVRHPVAPQKPCSRWTPTWFL